MNTNRQWTKETRRIWERKGIWEFEANVGYQKMIREWELMVMKGGEMLGNEERNGYEGLFEEVGTLKV